MTSEEAFALQRSVCERIGVEPAPPGSKVGIALATIQTVRLPLHGLRHPPERETNGWYIWAGIDTYADDPDFFEPLHVEHLIEEASPVVPYLALPPAWRFLIAPDYEDLWEDRTLLEVVDD